jgi:hypothetical protein
LYIQHRINSPAELDKLPIHFGAEIDIRYHCDSLVLKHDPFGHHIQAAVSLQDWLQGWHHQGPLVLNVKSEGIETACLDLMKTHTVHNWFFLDLSPPYLIKYGLAARRGLIDGLKPANIAVRFSEYEPLEQALALAGMAGWVWIDCFTHMPLTRAAADTLRRAGFRLCIVSPELQKHDLGRIDEFHHLLRDVEVDAICTKRPDLWMETSTAR